MADELIAEIHAVQCVIRARVKSQRGDFSRMLVQCEASEYFEAPGCHRHPCASGVSELDEMVAPV